MIAAVLVFAAALAGTGRVYGENEGSSGRSCKLILQTDLDPKKEPLVLAVKKTEIRENGQLEDVEVERLDIAIPEVKNGQGFVEVESGKQLLFACTGKRNYNPVTKSQTAYATCQDGKLTIKGKKVTVKTDSCTHIYAESWLRETHNTCGRGEHTGTVLVSGFQLEDGSYFTNFIMCFNATNATAMYSSHDIPGQALKGGVKSSIRRKFSKGPKDLFSKVNPDNVYRKKAQEEAFKQILGDSSSYISDTQFLARGHLAPDADFIYNSQQLSTYWYTNVAPQWQDFNAGNWLTIENAVRDLAVKVSETINVYTGTHGILKLKDEHGNEQQVYLDPVNKLIPVPEVFWKIVQHPVTKECTVAVGHNNLFLTDAPTPICTTATPNGWPTLDDLKKGPCYYCDYDDFIKAVTYAPTLECKDMFEFPEKSH